jgi:hypothetical protein
MSKRIKPWWIKERDNPQLGTYWVACGQLSKTDAMKMESCLYGMNFMHRFDTEADYEGKLAELKKRKERVQ